MHGFKSIEILVFLITILNNLAPSGGDPSVGGEGKRSFF